MRLRRTARGPIWTTRKQESVEREKVSERLVRKEGFEPPRPFGHKILSLARLPVPPLPRGASILAGAASRFHRDFEDSRPTAGKGSLEGRRLFWLRISVDLGKTRRHNNVSLPGSRLGACPSPRQDPLLTGISLKRRCA